MRNMTSKQNVRTVDLYGFYDDHHCSVNMGHYAEGNVELRLVGGQKDYPCFRNTVESLFWIVDRCKHISWNNTDSIVEIFKGCNQYVFDRLNTYVKQSGQISDSELLEIRHYVKREELL